MIAREKELKEQIAIFQENKSELSLELSEKRNKVTELIEYLENNDASFIKLKKLTDAIQRKNEVIYHIMDAIAEAKRGIAEFKIFESSIKENINNNTPQNVDVYALEYQEKLNKLNEIDLHKLKSECSNDL